MRLLLANLGRDYVRVPVDIFAGETLTDEYGRINPTRTVPTCYTVADVALFGYLHVAGEAGYDLSTSPRVSRWLERVERQPGYMNDVEPYPANAAAGAGRSIYD